ncbi:MAG: hypothetical protein ABI910_10915 [Gemmatimonadota bacterium]
MNLRSTPPDPPPAAPTRLTPWLIVALAVVFGVILAFRYGLRITPLIDGIR